MPFKPRGGFPSIVRKEEADTSGKSMETRGLSKSNIVSINNIMESKKKENLFIAFGTEEEDGITYAIERMITDHPHKYNKISYRELSENKLPKTSLRKQTQKFNLR